MRANFFQNLMVKSRPFFAPAQKSAITERARVLVKSYGVDFARARLEHDQESNKEGGARKPHLDNFFPVPSIEAQLARSAHERAIRALTEIQPILTINKKLAIISYTEVYGGARAWILKKPIYERARGDYG